MDTVQKMRNLLVDLGYSINEDDMAQGDVDLRDFVMDSLEFVSLVVEIENTFAIELPDDFLDFEILASLRGMVNTIESILIRPCNVELNEEEANQ